MWHSQICFGGLPLGERASEKAAVYAACLRRKQAPRLKRTLARGPRRKYAEGQFPKPRGLRAQTHRQQPV